MGDLGHGRELDDAPGVVGVSRAELPPLPDAIMTDPDAGRVDPRRWFPHPERPLEIEIGCGKGTFLLEQARARPETNFLGIEIAGEYYAYTADRVRRAQLTNARVLRGDAADFLKWRCPAGIVSVLHLYFSDPWPKAKHHKNRVVQNAFLAQALRVLMPEGELRIVTDHDDYWAWIEQHLARWCVPGRFERLSFEPPATAGAGEVVGTNFERKYAREGRAFHAVRLRSPAAR